MNEEKTFTIGYGEPDMILSDEDQADELKIEVCQYAIIPGGIFQPTTTTVSKVPAGVYTPIEYNNAPAIRLKTQNIGDLIVFENSITDTLLHEFNQFWELREKYEKMGEIHKRGYLLHGPPGGGKTSLVEILKSKFIAEGNIVMEFNYALLDNLRLLKAIEPNRKVMVTIEDIDAYVKNNEETLLLNFLDGDQDFSNIVVIATTNYIENLPDRISNRPSRFDRVEYVGFPNKVERETYLTKKANCINGDMSMWLDTTENWTFAHIKELLLATEVYEIDFDDTVERINTMRRKEASSADYERKLHGQDEKGTLGFS